MKIHERLRVYRKNHGWILKFIASKAGMSIQRMSAIERGAISLSVDEFEYICLKAYEVNPSIFFTNEFANDENFN